VSKPRGPRRRQSLTLFVRHFTHTTFSRNHSPRQSISEDYPALHPEIRTGNQNPPVIPPRRRSPPPVPNSVANYTSPFDDSESDSNMAHVPLPPRNNHITTARNIHYMNDSSSGDLDACSSPSSLNSISTEINSIKNTRPGVPPPPRPPPRPKGQSSSSDSQLSSSNPPPLPNRRGTNQVPDEPPRSPHHTAGFLPNDAAQNSSPGSSKLFGSSKLPPPPTRIIAPGDKLPPARRPPSPSSGEESGDEDQKGGRPADSLPDSSRTSRRPPVLSIHDYKESKITVQAYTGHVAVSGEFVVVASAHHVKLFDLSRSESHLYSLDGKDVGLKELKVTSCEFRPAIHPADNGFILWMGTKDGHLLELDIRTMSVTGTKFVAHSHQVMYIFRHGRSMVTLDHHGKALIFTPEGAEDVRLSHTPKVARITDKLEFAKIIEGRLWTADRSDMHAIGITGKTPIVRIYDIFLPGCTSRSLSPPEQVGAVTSGTIVPSQPHHVYLGHEGGYVSLWTNAPDGFPQCVDVMKVSVSDVLSLEGVNKRLWAGGRKGMISAYDVSVRPWVVTNCWNAHGELPVMRLSVDCYGINRTGRLRVVSVGRDEHIRFWDGLLGVEWIGELLPIDRTIAKRS
jgi:hypothetical protein